MTEAGAALIARQVDAAAQRRNETEQQLQSSAEAIQPPSSLIGWLSLCPAETLLAAPASPDAYFPARLVLQASAWRMRAGADALQRDQADLDAGLTAAKAARKGAANVPDDIAAAHAACAAAKATASPAVAIAARLRNPAITLAAPGVQRYVEVKPRGKPRHAAKRKPAERARAAAGRKVALAHPTGLCAMNTGRVARTRLRPPVPGVIVKGWGEATDAGPAMGVSYQVLSGARVIAPCGGRVVFAKSFRSYGRLLIVDCGGGYHMVFSGLEKLDVQLGQKISAGKPVGVMPLSGSGPTMRRQVLYIELRHNGHPVNPWLWLRKSS